MVRMPIFGHTFFGHNSAISGPIGLKFFMGFQTIIYRLVMRNLRLRSLFFSFDFRATFGRKMGVATTRAPNGLEPPNQTKMGGPFGPITISKSCFRNFQG